ncbi:putative serine-rich protein [Cocos nucifera]|uniref:Putative serine-rich protein n=1 Tax=Cocos nucifera TaxID=13894 RepID=A0A8K0I2W7_COCNU|nr:putative serine-rich protein [Cocos nucifera]
MEGTKLSGRDDGFPGWAGGSASEGRDRSQLRSFIGNYGNLQLVSSSHAEKESEDMAAARGEGRVESWILSSD